MDEASRSALGESKRVSASTLANYALPVVSLQFVYMMVLVMYMNFATDVLALAPAAVGTIFFLSKVWDAFSDPLVGYLSDRTHSRFGRRRSWMLASALPVAVMTVMLWSPPRELEGTALYAWVAFSVFGFYTAYTVFYVPQLAYGAEVTSEPGERNRIFGVRQVGYTVGMLGAFTLAAPLIADTETGRESAATLARWLAVTGFVLTLACTLRLPAERPEYAGRGATNPLRALRDVMRNRHARLLLFVYFIEVLGIGGTSAMTVYVLKYVTKAVDQLGLVFLVYTVSSLVTIPFWLWLGKRYERKYIWIVAMAVQAIGYGSMAFQDEGRIALMIFSSLLTGMATSCGQTFGHAIKADVVDYDEHMTGERKEGAYFAVWSLASKLGSGLMVAISGVALQASGFTPNVEQTSLTKWTILLLMGGAPFLTITIGMLAFTRFELTGSEHAKIRTALDARTA